MKHNIVIGITGASGSIYAKLLLQNLLQLHSQINNLKVVMSANAKTVWQQELNETALEGINVEVFEKDNFFAPFASGSAQYNTMVVCPCSMGTMARIATGVSNDLITRAADVILKERRKLILVTRDTPLNLIHINNMKTITEAGGIICPASPSFYNNPTTVKEVALTVVSRVVDLMGLQQETYRWGSK